MVSWSELCEDPMLRDLPYKIETDRYGQIMMSPAKGWHSNRAGLIQDTLRDLMDGGRAMQEVPVQTSGGVKVPDVGWFSAERLAPIRREAAYSIAPEICVEVLSESNTDEQMFEKMALYFATGAIECWLCSDDCEMRFFNSEGQLAQSVRCPDFPQKLKI